MTIAQPRSDSHASSLSPRPTATRRTVVKGTAVIVASSITVDRISGTAAADSEFDVELTTTATIPEKTIIWVTVEEYEADDDGSLVDSATVAIDDGEQTYDLGLPGTEEWYDFEIELGSDDGELTPEIESILLEITEIENDEDDDDGDDDGITIILGDDDDGFFGFALDFWPFGDAEVEEDDEDEDADEDGGFFTFDFGFWPFGDSDDDTEEDD